MVNDSLIIGADGKARCWWAGTDPLYNHYHDTEWGRPVADDIRLYEKICLEGFQAGLSWLTILKKRDNFRKAFAGFDFEKVARFTEDDVMRLLADTGIIRHRGKIEAAIKNARLVPALIEEFGSLAAYFWSFAPAASMRHPVTTRSVLIAMPMTTESVALSKDLKWRGFQFLGPTTMYAHMQAMGVVNDHMEGCFCRAAVETERANFVV